MKLGWKRSVSESLTKEKSTPVHIGWVATTKQGAPANTTGSPGTFHISVIAGTPLHSIPPISDSSESSN